jgi:hypothetical protein
MATEKLELNKYRQKLNEIMEGSTLNDFDACWRMITFFKAQGEEVPFSCISGLKEWELTNIKTL